MDLGPTPYITRISRHLDLSKASYALCRSRCLEILVIYGVGPRSIRLLRRCWERIQMVAQAGGYYGEPFQGEIGVTKGDPMSPIIFNMVVYAVVRHWESLVSERTG